MTDTQVVNITGLFQDILDGTPSQDLDEQFPFYPLDSPGMPLPGPNFLNAAEALGGAAELIVTEGDSKTKRLVSHGPYLHYLYRRALYDDNFTVDVDVKGQPRPAPFIPGHLVGDNTDDMNGGPRRAKIMLLGKWPGIDEMNYKRNLCGPTSREFWDACTQLGVGEAEWAEWYCTNLCKWPQLDAQSDSLPMAWKKDCAVLLEQEIRLVRPYYILCLGSDASKFLLGTPYGVTTMVGRVVDYTVNLFARGEDPLYQQIKVMAVTHPAQVYRRPEMFDSFKDQIGLFLQLTNGVDIGGREKGVCHTNIYKERHLRQVVNRIKSEIKASIDPLARVIAVDGEWEGDNPTEPGSYLRTIQFSHKEGESYTVVLRHQGGSPAFQPGLDRAIPVLAELLKANPEEDWYPQIGGHWFRSDLPWILNEGLDLRSEYMPAGTPEACRHSGGWDTSVMYHANNESTSYGLSDMAVRLTMAPRYDQKLEDWKTDYCHRNGIKISNLEGYGECPGWVLYPEPYDNAPHYGGYDADVTRRIAIRCMETGGLLDNDWYGNSCWEPYWVAHSASAGFLEMEMNGIMLDRDRMDKVAGMFTESHDRLLDAFRQQINWPLFNPNSQPQCVAFLFGDSFTKKRNKNGNLIPVAPAGAVTLGLQPVKTTGKRSKMWADIAARGDTRAFSPSTDKEVLGIIGHAHPLAMQLRDLRFIGQVLTSTLRRPLLDGQGCAQVHEGYFVYDKGMGAIVHWDGRVRTHLSQLKETGRASSYRPPLQNISKRREDDYARILGELHEHPIRSIFRAAPGHVLVECDYQGAELAVLAWMANDPVMTDHVRRGTLPESDPDHYDIHSQTAVRAFRLTCEPTKTGLRKSGNKGLRVAAKNVNFGIPYGRMAPAIARQCREEGVNITTEETEALIQVYFDTYTHVIEFLAECRERSQEERWLSTSCGRLRRFINTRDRSVIGEQERQAQNFPIQGSVADFVSRAIYQLYAYRWEHPELTYRMLLQIHDAILFEVPIPQVARFVNEVLPVCMVDRVPIHPRRLNNTPMEIEKPYHFGIDYDIQLNWGEDITEKQMADLGIVL